MSLKPSPEQREVVDRAAGAIERNARLLVRLVDETLDLTRVARGHARTRRVERRLRRARRGGRSISSARRRARRASLSARDSAAHTQRSTATRRGWQQIVWNLLTNAVKFQTAGRAHRSARQARWGVGGVVGARYWRRHRSGVPAVRVRTFSPGDRPSCAPSPDSDSGSPSRRSSSSGITGRLRRRVRVKVRERRSPSDSLSQRAGEAAEAYARARSSDLNTRRSRSSAFRATGQQPF
jgi:hypothetical protein